MIKARIEKPDIGEILKRIGMPETAPDAVFLDGLRKRLEQAERTARPKLVYRILETEETGSGILLSGTETVLGGADIRAHLEDCTKAVLLAVTLGTEPERLLLRSLPEEALVLDACFSVLTEEVCSRFEEDLGRKLAESGLNLTGRFSPGYGDLPIGLQGDFLRILNAERILGLTVSDNGILIPRKSVTAVLGVSDRPVTGIRAGCDSCAIADRCEYRKEGNSCGK